MLGLARAFEQMGNREAAQTAYRELRGMWSSADAPLLEAVDDSLSR
jgi:hypothetical protein